MPSPPFGENDKETPKPWLCLHCGNPFDKLPLEEQLIGEVKKLQLEWVTQDLKCGKCGSLRVNDFMEHCSCGGSWGCSIKKESIKERLAVLGSVAKGHGLGMLKGVVDGVGA